MPTPLQKQTYDSIIGIFDFAEKVLDSVEKGGKEVENLIPHVDKMLTEVEEGAEIIADNFLKYTKSGHKLSGVEKLRIENAQKKINSAIAEFMKLQPKN